MVITVWWSFIRIVSHLGCLPSDWSLIWSDGLTSGWAVFFQGGLITGTVFPENGPGSSPAPCPPPTENLQAGQCAVGLHGACGENGGYVCFSLAALRSFLSSPLLVIRWFLYSCTHTLSSGLFKSVLKFYVLNYKRFRNLWLSFVGGMFLFSS